VYQEAKATVIGRRWDVKRDKGTSKQIQVEVDDIFCYVSIKNTLKLVLQQLQSWSLINRRGEEACSNVVTDWLHGCNGLQLQDYCAATFPLSISIFVQISFDDVLYRYPSTETKQNLAAAVIKAFPNLHSLGPLGHVRTVFLVFGHVFE